ncbi:MAG: GIY-YIG nuclease family protein [Patescibacteria group bacterium]
MFYTYILKEKQKHHFYVGSSNDLNERLQEHAQGLTRSTRGRVWNLYCYFAFPSETLARKFEQYLKTGSGRAFAKRHFEFQVDEALA